MVDLDGMAAQGAHQDLLVSEKKQGRVNMGSWHYLYIQNTQSKFLNKYPPLSKSWHHATSLLRKIYVSAFSC